MKYIITESRLESTIVEYLNKVFPLDNVFSTSPTEYDYETGENYDDDTRVEFYLGDYENEDTVFRWYACEYFYENSDPRERCPIVTIEHPYDNNLDGFFGNKWEEPFKKWFTKNFDLPVKTVESTRLVN